MSDDLLAGAAEVNITPSWPMHLVGMGREFVAADGETFSYHERDEPTAQVHDPLMLQVTVLQEGGERAVVISSDLLYTVALEEVRAAAAEVCEVAEAAVFYSATHNHNGPARSDQYAAFLVAQVRTAARKALDAMRPVDVYHARGRYDRLIHDRAEPWGPVDGSVDVVRFVESGTDDTVCMWWNYGCHACSLSWDFNQFSADYPGALRRRASEKFGEVFPIAFLSGCTGNVQPIGMRRFKDPPNMFLGVPKGDYEMVERLGCCVADAGLNALDRMACPVDTQGLCWRNGSISLPIRITLREAELRERRRVFEAAAGVDGANPGTPLEQEVARIFGAWLDLLEGESTKEAPALPIVGAALALGELAVVFAPLELAWQVGVRLRERSPFPQTLLSTTSLGFESYLTESKFYARGEEARPYETFGLMDMAGFSYTESSTATFEDSVMEELLELREAVGKRSA